MNNEEAENNEEYFELDPNYVDTSIVKSICLDPTISTLLVEINGCSLTQTVHLRQFTECTIEPLKKQLREALHSIKDRDAKQKIINSVISCINQNIDRIKEFLLDLEEDSKGNHDNEESSSSSFSKILVELVSRNENIELFLKDQYGKPYVAVRLGTDRHLEIIPLESKKFRHYAARIFRENTDGKVISKDSISNAINTLAANAEFEGPTIPLHLRVAWGNPVNRAKSDCIYYDMTDAHGRMIEISIDGCRIINGTDKEIPILFKRYNHTAQVEPDWNYDPYIFDKFIDLTNIKPEHRQLIKVYIVCLIIPEIAHPILDIHGPAGAAKSSLQTVIKMLIDPSKPTLLSLHKEIREFIQQVAHNYLAFYDNVKYISPELSDEICKAVTGIGSTKRELYTDDDDVVYEYKHCLSFTGINVPLTESDALDRCLMTEQSDIDDEQRRKEEDVLAEFERIRSKLLPYILDTISKVIRIRSTLKLPMLTRMADFTEWGEAISRAMGYESMSFIEALCQNRNERNLVAIEESMVGSLLIRFWLDFKLQNIEGPCFTGSPEDLYQQLVYFAQAIIGATLTSLIFF